MRKIAVITQVYNAARTLASAIESVLAQTYPHFVYYVLDSASTDGTSNIISEYAQRDSRIVPLRNDYNKLTAYMDKIPHMAESVGEDGLFAMLDADDTYHPEAFETLISFMNEHNLDIAVGGFKEISSESGAVVKNIVCETDTVYDRMDYTWFFPLYLNSAARTVWGKLFRMNIFKQCDFTRAKTLSFGADTAFTLEAIKHTDRFGVKACALVDYYYSPKSISYIFTEERLLDGKTFYDTACDFLSAFGEISENNRHYLLMVYMSTIRGCIKLMKSARLEPLCQKSYLRQLTSDPITKEALSIDSISPMEKFNILSEIMRL